MTEEKSKLALFPFLEAGIAWLVIGLLLCWFRSDSTELRWANVRWMLILWSICLMDLLALAKLMQTVLLLMAEPVKNQGELVIRASSWGTAKLACLGILGLVLYHGRAVPGTALLAGLATMVVVPLAGGLRWYQRILRHA